MSEVHCPAKHTKPQVPDEAWRCPKCGIGPDHKSGGFVIEGGAEDSADDCTLLHDSDELACYNCEFSATGKSFARAYRVKAGLVKCEACAGSGLVRAAGVDRERG